MTDDTLRLRCKACQHEWLERLQLPMELSAFARELKLLRCLRCDSADLQCLFGSEPQS